MIELKIDPKIVLEKAKKIKKLDEINPKSRTSDHFSHYLGEDVMLLYFVELTEKERETLTASQTKSYNELFKKYKEITSFNNQLHKFVVNYKNPSKDIDSLCSDLAEKITKFYSLCEIETTVEMEENNEY